MTTSTALDSARARRLPAAVVPLVALALLAGCGGEPVRPDGTPLPEPRAAGIVAATSPRPLVALALGSGGSRGFAHVGVIKALERAGIAADIVVGSSSGAVVASLYAAGLDATRLEAVALDVEESDLVDFSLLDGMKVRGVRLAEFINRSIDYRTIERLPRAFAVVATDATTGAMTVFNRGNTGLAVRASAAVPRLFVSPEIGGRQYIDGGLSSPIPVKVARAMGADVVVAVDITLLDTARSPSRQGEGAPNPVSRGARRALLEEELKHADVIVKPRVGRVGLLNFAQKHEQIEAGEVAGAQALAELRAAIEAAGRRKREQAAYLAR